MLSVTDQLDIDWQQPINRSSNLARGLVGFWLPGGIGYGSKYLYDLSGERNHGTLTNGPTWSGKSHPGGFGGLDFDGVGDYVDVSESQSLRDLPTTHNFTVNFWFLSNSATQDVAALAWNGTDDLVFYPNDSKSGSGGTRVFWRQLGRDIIAEAGPNLSGGWHLFTFTSRASNDHEAYRDGVSVGTSAADGSGLATAGPFSNLLIGTFEPAAQNFDGNIGPVSIHSRALSATEVRQLYTESKQGYPTLLNRIRLPQAFSASGGGPAPFIPYPVINAMQGVL